MTREEEIKKQAVIYAEWSNDGGLSVANDIELVKRAFIDGAKWADNNICLSSLWNDSKFNYADWGNAPNVRQAFYNTDNELMYTVDEVEYEMGL